MYFLINILFLIQYFIKSNIIIRSPLELAQKFPDKKINISLTTFGKIPFGQKITGKIYFDDSLQNNKFSCEKLSMNIPDNPLVDESPFILLDNGICSYYEKIKNVQEAKGHLAIIINDKSQENISNIFINDARGKDIIIPGIIISYKDGEIIKNYIKENINKNIFKEIILEINIHFENNNNIVYYDLYYTPDQQNAYNLLTEIEKYHKELREKAILRIHPVTYTHPEYNISVKIYRKNCISSGKYCIRENNNIKGERLLKQAIKQKCIYKYIFEEEGRNINNFFKYMNEFYYSCLFNKNEMSDKCISQIENKYFFSDKIEKCYIDSFIGANEEKQNNNYDLILDNKILSDDKINFHSNLINRIPSLTINGRLYTGAWKGDDIFDALCSSFIQKPSQCNAILSSSYSFYKIGSIILLVLALNVIIYLICKKYLKGKIQEKVNSTDINKKISSFVNSFIAVKDTKL